jgi:hypothetical protein
MATRRRGPAADSPGVANVLLLMLIPVGLVIMRLRLVQAKHTPQAGGCSPQHCCSDGMVLRNNDTHGLGREH